MRPSLLALLTLTALPAAAQTSPCDTPQADWLFGEDFEQGALGWDAWFAQSPFIASGGTT